MKRRTLLQNLVSSMAVVPLLGASQTRTVGAISAFDHKDLPTPNPLLEPDDEVYIRRAIRLAGNVPKYPFGALLVDRTKGVVVAEGWNRSIKNPTWHGEMDAINKCAASHPKIDWSKLTLYTTAEPCAMCQGAVAWSGISRVVFGSSIPFLKSLNWWAIDIRAEELARLSAFRSCTVVGGVLEEECNKLFRAALNVKF
jgi:tRNA(adenine34) deaminase